MTAAAAAPALRRLTLGALMLVLIQAAIGMIVNLDVTIPARYPGASPGNYFSGSASSVGLALLAFAAVACYSVVLFLLPGVRTR